MKNIFFAIFGFSCISLVFTCCGTMKTKQSASNLVLPNYLVLDSLVCKDLSENLKGLSSGDDEILLMTQIRNRQREIWGASQGYIIFSKNYMMEKIAQRIPIDKIQPNAQFVIILLEQDSKLKHSELGYIVDTSNAFLEYPKIDRVLLQNELGDDDLLDVKVIPLEGIENQKRKKTKLYGIHLFDKYEYWLYWHLE